MKKIFMILAVLSVFALSAFADESSTNGQARNEAKWTDMSYVNVPILKILEGKDGYAIVYQKNRHGVGNVVIPKKWAQGNTENPRKLKFRSVKTSLGAYMTIVKDGGEFKRVILSIPMNKNDSIWGLADYRKNMEGADKDTLEDLEF